jgi:hypothetical protein
MNMKQQKTYRYIITLTVPIWPRKLADELRFLPYIFKHLVSIKDLQNDTHVYGATYTVKK